MKPIHSALLIVAAVSGWIPTVAWDQSRLDAVVPQALRITDPKLLNPCNIGEAIDDLLLPFGIPFNFENQSDCRTGQRQWNYQGQGRKSDDLRVSFTGLTVAQTLDEITSSLGFSWKQVGDAIVVRPTAAWTSPRNVLHVQVRRIEVTGLDTEVAFRFQGGTLLEALNELVKQYGQLTWEVDHGAIDNAVLVFYSLDDRGASLVVPMRQPSNQ